MYPVEMVQILKNLCHRKNPNARLILLERVYENGSDLDLVKINDKSIREVCHQFLNGVEEVRTQRDYEYIVGRL